MFGHSGNNMGQPLIFKRIFKTNHREAEKNHLQLMSIIFGSFLNPFGVRVYLGTTHMSSMSV